MRPLFLTLFLVLGAGVLLAQQQPSTGDTPSTTSSAARQPAQTKGAAPQAPAEPNAAPPEDDPFERLPDQNIDPTSTTPVPATQLTEQKQAASSMQKSIPAGALSLAASLGKNILVVRVNGRDVKTFPISVGVKAHQTPQGHFGIRHIVWNPSWHPPKAGWAKNKQAAAPGTKANPMKVVKIFFQEPDYYIHGTDHESALGGAASHGCIRMSQSDVYSLGRLLQERGGAPRQPDWYARVVNGGQTASVMLPKGVPIVVGW
ncbi:MAG: ErfK/YbiS/YcfS/YnhG family protein [Acidobacteria bacterium]|nr:ErfK/YbiS/YcfS/YnhG family protein [Acidobacteriota bacterium]